MGEREKIHLIRTTDGEGGGQRQERDGEGHDQADERGGGQQSATPSKWEWLTGVLGMLLVFGVIGFMVYMAMTTESRPPDLVVQPVSMQPVTNGYLVQVKVTNRGGMTASAVHVEGTLKRGDTEIETSELSIPYVPSGSTREGGLFFSRDPSAYTLEARAVGYEKP